MKRRSANGAERHTRLRAESRTFFAELGRRIAQMRKAHGYTQAELARRLGVSQQAVFTYELGDRHVSVLILMKIVAAFRVSLHDLIAAPELPRVHRRRVSPRALRHAERLQPTYAMRWRHRLTKINRASVARTVAARGGGASDVRRA